MVLIIGSGKSGVGAAKLLKANGKATYIYDDSKENAAEFEDRLKDYEYIVTSPAIRPDHRLIRAAEKIGKRVISEIELSYKYKNKESKVVAITGTNGKTTTVSLIDNIITKPHYKAGNIGIAWSNECTNNGIAVLEISSFQLEHIESFRPNIALITNIAPDHIEHHGSMEEYIRCKLNILKNQTKEDYLVVSEDVYNRFISIMPDITPRILVFSCTSKQIDGAYMQDQKLYYSTRGISEEIMNMHDIHLVGRHNIENILAAICVCKLLGETNEAIISGITTFRPPKHRLEVVRNDKFTCIDDSKATNVHAAINGIRCFKGKSVIWLLGGSDKGENFDDLFVTDCNIKCYILFGATRTRLKDSAKRNNIQNYVVFNKFDDAISHALNIAESGDIVLLSPACASFDEFSSFSKRGDYFSHKVNM